MGTVLLVQTQAPVIASAEQNPTQYISELYLSYGKDDKTAKDWLEKNGYTVIDQNLNEGAEGACRG